MRIQAKAYWFDAAADSESVKKAVKARHPGALVQTACLAGEVNGTFIRMIAAQTIRASESKNLLANKAEIDFLLRLAGTTQITKAIEKVGTRKGSRFLLVVADPRKQVSGPRLEGAKGIPEATMTEEELDLVEDAALLNADRG